MQTTNQSNLLSLPVLQFYKALLTSPELLANGFQLILKYLKFSIANRQNTLINLTNSSIPILTLISRVYPILFVKNTFQNNNQLSQMISLEQKQKTREYIVMNLLLSVLKQQKLNKQFFQALIQFLNHFHNEQGYEQWVQLYQQLLTILYEEKNKNIAILMISILKHADDRINVLSRHLLSFTIKNQAVLCMSEQDSLQIIYYCIKSLSYLNGTDDEILKQFVSPHIQNLLLFIKEKMLQSMRMMKYSLKIATVLCGDYQVKIDKSFFNTIKNSVAMLMKQFIKKLNIKTSQLDDLDDEQDQSEGIVIIIYQMIQLISTLTFSGQIPKSQYNIFLILCLPSLFLNLSSYNYYVANTDVYLIDIEDQGQKSLRNKSISFLVELYQSNINFQIVKKGVISILDHFLKQNQVNHVEFISMFFKYLMNGTNIQLQFQEYHNQIFQEAVYYLLYSLTQEILQAENPTQMQKIQEEMIIMLGLKVKTTKNPLIEIGCINILNKIIKNMATNLKQMYYKFLVEILFEETNNQNVQIGLVLSIFRGFAYISNQYPLLLNSNASNLQFILPLLDRLFLYLLDKSIQQEVSHIILQFLDVILKVGENKNVLQSLLPFQKQSQILNIYIHDGMISTYLIRIYSIIACQQLVNAIYQQLMLGNVKDQNIMALSAEWIKQKKLILSEQDIKKLLSIYSSDFLGIIIKNYLKVNKTVSQDLSDLLNHKINPAWLLSLLSMNLLKNSEKLFIQIVINITKNLVSQYQIQKCLVLPYYVFLKQALNAINFLNNYQPGLYQNFIQKLLKYAQLFKGDHLKVVTGRVLINIAYIDSKIALKVKDLINVYGQMTVDQWEDQQKEQQGAIDSMFNMKFINDQVEQEFGQAFGQIAWDSKQLDSIFRKFKEKYGFN